MSPPSSPRRGSKHHSVTPSRTRIADVGKLQGNYDTNSVQDRVRQWQAQGGGVMTADEYGEEENPSPKHSGGRKKAPGTERQSRTPSKGNSKDCNVATPSSSAGKGVRGNDDKSERARSRSAPAKRIISDGHWKKKRSPPKNVSSCKTIESTAPQRSLGDGSIRVRPMSEPKVEETCTTGKQIKSQKRDSIDGEDGIRVYVTPPGSQRHSARSRRKRDKLSNSTINYESDAEAEKVGVRSESPNQRKYPVFQDALHDKLPQDKIISGRRRRRSSAQKAADADESPRSARSAPIESKGSTRSQKGNILSQVFGESRRRVARQAPEPIFTPRVPSIEAWLNDTPDPFVEAEEPPPEFIAPVRPPVEKKGFTPENEALEKAEDPNRIWDTLETKGNTGKVRSASGRRRRIPSAAIYEDNPFPEDFDSDAGLSASGRGTASASKFVDLVQAAPETSRSSLKRRSARKSISTPTRDRLRSRTPEERPLENDAVSGVSSNHTTSSVEGPDPNSPFRPPGLSIKRPFPSTGQRRLSTIASVETFSTKPSAVLPCTFEQPERTTYPPLIEEDVIADEAQDQFDPSSLKRRGSHLTKHADLISVLSVPKSSSRSIQSARSIRTNRSRLATATVGDLMRELSTDESKYIRELQTLVDGVIPVLLTCVLSKSDSAVAAGLFRPSAHTHEDSNFTKPIIDMGIALERLRTLHKRIPHDDPASLLTWAHGAQRVYAEYLKAWRMGFQDVVVNLAPAANSKSVVPDQSSETAQMLDEGLPRNQDGDVVNGDGERVDVAFLLKRPLVRLKYLQKTLKGINVLKPSAEADVLAMKYQKLVDDARQRSNEERARLEDEAASNIDPTRTRDPRNLAPLAGVVIDRTRRVRARDNFNLAFQHSSGQRVDCHVELILRDEASDISGSGDLLICEVDATGKWLLLPPVQSGYVSARNGDLQGEIVVMIRGISGKGTDWQELLSLRSEDEQAGFEWVQMLGPTPVPPKITRNQSFLNKQSRRKSAAPLSLIAPSKSATPIKSRTPSPREIEVPIGEQANDCKEKSEDRLASEKLESSPEDLQIRSHSVLETTPSRLSSNRDQIVDSCPVESRDQSRDQSHEPVPSSPARTPRSFKEALGLCGTSTTVGLKRSRAKRHSRHGEALPSSHRLGEQDRPHRGSHTSPREAIGNHRSATSVKESPHRPLSPCPQPHKDDVVRRSKLDAKQQKSNPRPSNHRSPSSVPSMELPYIPKARQHSPPTTPSFEPEQEPEWSLIADSIQPHSTLTKKHPAPSGIEAETDSSPPATPIHRSPSSVKLNGSKPPVLTPTPIKPRRSSSPLKHEYEPSTASETSSDSDASTIERKRATSVSDSSDDEELEGGDAPTPLLPLGALKRLSNTKTLTGASLQSAPDGSIKPSESASQAPYKKVPIQPTKATKTIASIFSWSDTGSWQGLHPDECSIVITPGLIEAYEMSAAHSKEVLPSSSVPVVDADAFSDFASNVTSQNDDVGGDRPLIALELTPLVPLRRGTALDISIRSPPTPNSQITSGTNIMFRSRNPEECEALYALINHSRINNPTFIALQNARASGRPFGVDRRASTSGVGSKRSWFGGWGRSSSYRASSAPTPSIAPSDSSIGSMSSAFSALRRFGRGSGMFNISRSTITSRERSRANSVYTSSDNSSGSGASTPFQSGLTAAGGDAAIGLTNAKIRLYARETASRWRDMGSARLTIMRPEKNDIVPDGGPLSSSGHQGMHEKRIVINGKTKGEVLLDVQLGESCFERVARTGIALSVWEDVRGPNGEVGVVGAVGGVSGGRASVYMIQMKSEAETAYTFSIVGKLRY